MVGEPIKARKYCPVAVSRLPLAFATPQTNVMRQPGLPGVEMGSAGETQSAAAASGVSALDFRVSRFGGSHGSETKNRG